MDSDHAFRDPVAIGRTASTWLRLAGIVLAIQALLYLWLGSAHGFGTDLSVAAVDAGVEALDTILAIGVFVLFVGAAITFLRWMRRAYSNVGALGFRPRFGRRQTVWTWFVPILNIWRPKQLANDIWRSGDASAPPRVATIEALDTPGWLLAWWLLLLVPVGASSEDSLWSWTIFAGTSAPAAFLCAHFVQAASDRQRARLAVVAAQPTEPAPAIDGPFR